MPVGEFGGEAYIVAHYGEDAASEEGHGALVGEDRAEAAFGEEGVPEGVVLEHVENTWNAYGFGVGCFFGCQFGFVLLSEGVVVLLVDLVSSGSLAFAFGVENAFALIAGEAEVAVGESEAHDLAVVGAAAALDGVGAYVGEGGEGLLRVEGGGGVVDRFLRYGVEGGAVCTH